MIRNYLVACAVVGLSLVGVADAKSRHRHHARRTPKMQVVKPAPPVLWVPETKKAWYGNPGAICFGAGPGFCAEGLFCAPVPGQIPGKCAVFEPPPPPLTE